MDNGIILYPVMKPVISFSVGSDDNAYLFRLGSLGLYCCGCVIRNKNK